MSNPLKFAFVSIAAIAVFLVGRAFSADPRTPSSDSKNVFDGKVLSISSKAQGEFGAILEKVQVRELGGKWFLVGRAVGTGEAGEWTKGRTTWYPVDDAGQIIEFDDVEQLKKAHRDAVDL